MATYFKAKFDLLDRRYGYCLFKDELLTPLERYEHAKSIPDGAFEIVEISRKKTRKLYGARFEIIGVNENGK